MRRYDKENLLWQSTVVIKSDPVGSCWFSVAFLAIVAFVALLTANSFGMCMGLAIERFPAKANEISALMVMAIVGGGIVSALLGFAQSSFGPIGIVATLGVCIAYLFVLGLFANKRAHLISVR